MNEVLTPFAQAGAHTTTMPIMSSWGGNLDELKFWVVDKIVKPSISISTEEICRDAPPHEVGFRVKWLDTRHNIMSAFGE